ncbi:MAG TPA: hypothetical protein PKE45_20705, partial [Caldilineaceae bacterium]|nr:hypothetical protein [Caldilineaceae bacterium]
MPATQYLLDPIGFIQSPLQDRGQAPRQGSEGAPDAWLVVNEAVAEGLDGIGVGDELFVITWLHEARRDLLKLHPRGETSNPL